MSWVGSGPIVAHTREGTGSHRRACVLGVVAASRRGISLHYVVKVMTGLAPED